MNIRYMLIQPKISLFLIVMTSFLFTLSINYAYSAPAISLQYPQGWSLQESTYGYFVTSPEKRFTYGAEFVPSENLYSAYSTTDMNKIANNIITKDKSRGYFQLLDQSQNQKGNVIAIEYSFGGKKKMIVLAESNYGLFVTQYVGDPNAYNHYYNIAKSIDKTKDVDVTKLPEGQRIMSNIDQLRSNTLGLGTTFGGTGNPVDTWAKGMNNLGKPTELQQHYKDQQQCRDMNRLGC